MLHSKNFYLIFFIDVLFVLISFYGAHAIRFDFRIPTYALTSMWQILPIALIIKMVCFFIFGLYQGMWRYTSLGDLVNVMKATCVSTMSLSFFVLMVYRFQGYARSVFIIDAVLTFLLIGSIRFGIRLYFSQYAGFRLFPFLKNPQRDFKRLLIIGAGNTGEKVLREILDNPGLRLLPAGFLDDDPHKYGKTIHRVKVLGDIAQIDVYQSLFDEILIATPSASAQQMRTIVAICERTDKTFRTVPGIGELIDGKVSMKIVRNVTIQDLLDRKEVHLDKHDIARYLQHKRVLVTGAGGSIGSELVRQICRFCPDALAFVELSELNLFQIDQECSRLFSDLETVGFLADVRNLNSTRRVFDQFQPHTIFHAAAYKHVPMQELHPWEAVQNNVLGTRNLIQAAHEFQVNRFVLVSSDKAVRPTNVMGATKRVAEQLIACANHHPDSRFMAVRFGNVIGSSGSVIPTFQQQIDHGGPVTVTHPEITRYFMSIPEAAQLILQAGAMGTGGEIFILDMGTPVRISELARDLIRLRGYEPDVDIAIKYIGLRPGEKLYEELIIQGEGIVKTDHEKILVLKGNLCNSELLYNQIDELLECSSRYDTVAIKRQLKNIVPEYTPAL